MAAGNIPIYAHDLKNTEVGFLARWLALARVCVF